MNKRQEILSQIRFIKCIRGANIPPYLGNGLELAHNDIGIVSKESEYRLMTDHKEWFEKVTLESLTTEICKSLYDNKEKRIENSLRQKYDDSDWFELLIENPISEPITINQSLPIEEIENQQIADLSWYKQISKVKKVETHCPFAAVMSCPRYYDSVSLYSKYKGLSIDKNEDEKLSKYWKESNLRSLTPDMVTGITEIEGVPKHFHNLCPEVAGDNFGYFASDLYSYADEIDRKSAHQKFIKEGVKYSDSDLRWAYIMPIHYTDCPFFSVISSNPLVQQTIKEEFSITSDRRIVRYFKNHKIWAPFIVVALIIGWFLDTYNQMISVIKEIANWSIEFF